MLKTTKVRKSVYSSITLLCFLTACSGTFRQHTTIYEDGSGEMAIEFGYTEEENEEIKVTSHDDCRRVLFLESQPEITVTFEKREGKVWCGYSQPFENLETLDLFYKEHFYLEANILVKRDGKIIYDVPFPFDDKTETSEDVGNSAEESEDTWVLTLPGEILENNADKIIGNTLIWELNHPIDVFYAESLIKEKWSLGNYLANNVIVVVVGFIASLLSIWTFLRERK